MSVRGEEGVRRWWVRMWEKRAVVKTAWARRPAMEGRREGERVPSGAVRRMRMVGWRGLES